MTVPESPQNESTSSTRQLGVIDKDSQIDSQTDSTSESQLQINHQHWKQPSKLYYPRASPPDILVEERVSQNPTCFNGDNIYEWNIDGQNEASILQTMQQMTMLCTAYQTQNNYTDEQITSLLVSGFTGH